MMGKDVFISYSRKDYVDENKNVIHDNVVQKIKEVLTQNDISYWFDEEGIYCGDAFAPIIAKNIKEAKVFLFISTANSNASEWTAGEIATAYSYSKKIIPFRVDDSRYNDAVILHLAHLDYLDYYNNEDKSLIRLVDSIKEYLNEQIAKEEKEYEARLARERDENLKIEKERALAQIRERMDSVRSERESIFRKLCTLEAEASQVKLELEMIDSGYKELQGQEAALLDDDFEYRMRTLTDGTIEEEYIEPPRTIKECLQKSRPLRFAVLTLIALCVLETVLIIGSLLPTGHPRENNSLIGHGVPTNKELQNGFPEAIEYLDNHDIWVKEEMESIKGLVGIWDILNRYNVELISQLHHLSFSERFIELMVSAQKIVDDGGSFGNRTYCTREDDFSITFRQYNLVLLSKRIELGAVENVQDTVNRPTDTLMTIE